MLNLCLTLAVLMATTPEKSAKSAVKPLTELGKAQYKGFTGGLYPNGKNDRPAAHERFGLDLARQIQPLDASGKPSADGRIVLLSVGMSNTTQEFQTFARLVNADKDKNPKLVLVDGAQGGMSANRMVMTSRRGGLNSWMKIDQRLRRAGVTRAQVQAAWLKEADPRPSSAFPVHAQTLQDELAGIVQQMHPHFPNLKVIYLSSRTYGGYARGPLNPEPYAFETGFAVKWLIEQQLQGDPALNCDPAKGQVEAPWLSWGPYLWADGATRRADGVFYERGDFGNDGTHPSLVGRHKVAVQLLHFFETDSTTKTWFLKSN